MSQQVRVERDIVFAGDAKHSSGNIKGPMSPEMVTLYDDFLGIAVDTTNNWGAALNGTGDTFAIVAAQGGIVRIIAGSDDNDESIINSELAWYGDKKCIAEARIRLNDASGVCLFFGFSDAKAEMSWDYNGGTLTSTAADACGFLADADKDTSSIYCVGVKGDTEETAIDTGIDWADTAWHILRVECDTDQALFSLDGAPKGYMDVSQDGANALCITIGVEARGTGTDSVDIDYIKAWQER